MKKAKRWQMWSVTTATIFFACTVLTFLFLRFTNPNSTNLNASRQANSNSFNMLSEQNKLQTDPLFNNAYRDSSVKYADLNMQKSHESKYPQKVYFYNDEKHFKQRVTGYWGSAAQQRFDGVQIMKDSNFNDFTLAFANTASTEYNNLGANYWDQIQEIHAFGGAVTMSFGGATSDTSFFNNAPSAYVMYTKLLSICISYQIFSFDFDLEGIHSLDGYDLIALSQALAKVRTRVKQMFNRELQVKFTTGFIGILSDPLNIDTFCSYFDPTGSNVIWNDMKMTSIDKSSNIFSSSNPIHTHVQNDYDDLKKTVTYKNKSKDFILHHIGITANINKNVDWNGWGQYAEVCTDYFNKYPEEAKQIGSYGMWSISTDHKKTDVAANDQLDPEHQNPSQTNDKMDFQVTHVLQHFVNTNYSNELHPTEKLSEPKNLFRYSESQQYITLRWLPVKNAKFYRLKIIGPSPDNKSESKSVLIASVSRTTAAFSLRREYDNDDNEHEQDPVVPSKLLKKWLSSEKQLKFSVIAVSANSKQQEVTSKPANITVPNPRLTKTVKGNPFPNGQTEYFDQNIQYTHFDDTYNDGNNKGVYVTATQYIYYLGDIYKYISKPSSNVKVVNNQADFFRKSKLNSGPNSKEWIKMNVNLNSFGLSDERIKDLKNFEWNTSPKKVQTATYNFGDDTSAITRDDDGNLLYFTPPPLPLPPRNNKAKTIKISVVLAWVFGVIIVAGLLLWTRAKLWRVYKLNTGWQGKNKSLKKPWKSSLKKFSSRKKRKNVSKYY